MEQAGAVRQLNDAIDLIKMLEHLCSGLNSGSASSTDIPWAGIRLTLAQTRVQIGTALEQFAAPHPAEQQSATAKPEIAPAEPSKGPSRVRDLVPDDENFGGTFNRIQLTRDLQFHDSAGQ